MRAEGRDVACYLPLRAMADEVGGQPVTGSPRPLVFGAHFWSKSNQGDALKKQLHRRSSKGRGGVVEGSWQPIRYSTKSAVLPFVSDPAVLGSPRGWVGCLCT